MADIERMLAAMGAVPSGTTPKTIFMDQADQEPQYAQTDPLSMLVRTLKAKQIESDAAIKKKQEAAEKKADHYKTLREAGYNPQDAYKAVMAGDLLPPGEIDTSLQKKTTREKILDKISKGEILTVGEQQVYDDTIKHKTDESLDTIINDKGVEVSVDTKQKKTNEAILDKIAKGLTLTAGEKKIYDEVIKKAQPKPEENLDTIIGAGKEKMIAVISPGGKKGSVPASKLAAALAAGYKKR
jgi:hypothetical protein